MESISELLKASSLGRELLDEEADVLAALMGSRELADDEYLFEQGAADDALHLILYGKLEVVKKSGAGESASLAVLRAGALAGEMSFVDGEAHSVGLRALCPSKVLSLRREDFEGIVDKHPQLAYKVMRAVTRSAHQIVHRMNHEFVELSNYIFKQHGRY